MKKTVFSMIVLLLVCTLVMVSCTQTPPVQEETLEETETAIIETEAATEAETEPVDPSADLEEITVYLVGGSTVYQHPYDTGYYNRYGIGNMFHTYLYGKANVVDLSYDSASSSSFHRNSNYDTLIDNIKAGDYVIVMFGHGEFCDAEGDYTKSRSLANNIYKYYIEPIQAVEAFPILCTPIVKLSPENDYTGDAAHITKYGDYSRAILDLGATFNIPVVDLNAISKAKFEGLGYEEAIKYYAVEEAMYAEDGVTMVMDPTTVDTADLNYYGAYYMAYQLASELQKLEGIGDYVRHNIAEPVVETFEPYSLYSISDDEEKTADVNIYMLGDSIVAEHFTKDLYYTYGYGTQMEYYLTENVKVYNYGLGGRSSKSYINDAYYEMTMENIKEGDYLFISFGHNDKTTGDEYRFTVADKDHTDPTSIGYYLYEYYIKPAREKGAIPILFTPVVYLCSENDYTGFYVHKISSGDYPQAIRDLGEAFDVPVIDLTTITKTRYEELGFEGASKYHPILGGVLAADGVTIEADNSTMDTCHLNLYGAKYVAYRIACELQKIEGICDYVADNLTEPTEDVLVVNPHYIPKVVK